MPEALHVFEGMAGPGAVQQVFERWHVSRADSDDAMA